MARNSVTQVVIGGMGVIAAALLVAWPTVAVARFVCLCVWVCVLVVLDSWIVVGALFGALASSVRPNEFSPANIDSAIGDIVRGTVFTLVGVFLGGRIEARRKRRTP